MIGAFSLIRMSPMRRGRFFFPLKLPASCVLVIGLIVSFTLFCWAYLNQQHNDHVNFERRALFRVAAVVQGMTNAIEALQVVNQLFVTDGSVSREQFHSFTQPLRSRYSYIEAFAFQRLVTGDERPAFEARMGTRYPGFAIQDLINGKRVVAARKERYHVIDYREPMAQREAAFGLDASDLPFRDAARRAADSGLPSATGLFRLFKDRGEAPGFRIMMAVYKGGAVPADAAARRLAVVGYTVAVLRAANLFEKIFLSAGASSNAGLTIRMYAAASADENKLVYGQPAAAGDQPGERRAGWFGITPDTFSRSFEVAGTTWHMVITAQPIPFFNNHGEALFALLMGLLTTCVATAYLQSSALRSQRIQQLVAQRTDELRHVNELLIDDISARKQVEQALVISEQRSRELADLSSDWFWEQDEEFRYTVYTAGSMGKGSAPPGTILGATRWDLPVDPDASDWAAHRAMLEAHRPFKNFEFKTVVDGGAIQWFSASGKPLFDARGRFTGYRGTGRNISIRKAAEAALRESRTQLRMLADHQDRVKEDERKRIARDIHDDLGQNLMVLRLDVSMIAAHPESVAVTKERCGAALKQIDTTIKAVRAIMNDLRPAVLDLGLHAALDWQAKEFERRTGIACELHIDHEEFALDEKRATALFRIVQESLTNIIRHAQASQVQIEMLRADGMLSVKITDNGIGVFPDCRRKANAFGLAGIEERIHALGGTFSKASHPGQGMAITVSIPI
jgi:signal transduction histidine kinase